MLLPQHPGDIVAAALAEEETHSLDDGHHGENNAHCTGGGIAFEHADKEGVGHIVKSGDQHADNAGYSQPTDNAAYRRLGHGYKFALLFIHKYRLEM